MPWAALGAALAEPVPDGPSTQELLRLSREHRMTICAGLIERANDGKFYNASVVAMPDGRWARHRKMHEFVSELPRNMTGKLLRRVVREPHWNGAERHVA